MIESGLVKIFFQLFLFFVFVCPVPLFLGIAQLTLGMNVSFFHCVAFIGGCNKVCGSISNSLPLSLYLAPFKPRSCFITVKMTWHRFCFSSLH